MATYRQLTEAEQGELDALNRAVTAAIRARREWLDKKMHECSALQVGDDIYDLNSSAKVGVVSKLYRYWRDRDEGMRDDTFSISYEYQTGSHSYDNTSRQYRRFGTREDPLAAAEYRASVLR